MNIEVEVKMQIQLKKTKINCTCTKTLYPTLTNMLPLSCVFDSISENNKSVIDYVFIDLVGRSICDNRVRKTLLLFPNMFFITYFFIRSMITNINHVDSSDTI